jgi:hypothetical protein
MSGARRIGILLAVLVLSVGSASAQVLYGSLLGNVVDPQQAAVVSAAVTINNKATGFTQSTKTDDRGSYEFLNLPPGTYDVKISAPGFVSFEAREIAIVANNITRVDAPLKVGSITETVTVGAEVAALQTDRSDLHTDIGSKELTQIAVGGYRNYQSMMDFIPGTTPGQFQNASTDSPARALTTNVNGTALE